MENLLYALPLLACPVGMGLMMWLMMRGNRDQAMGSMQMPAGSAPAGQTAVETGSDDRLAQLRAQLGEVQAQQAAIAAQIEQLSAEDRPTGPRAAAAPEPVEPAPPPTQRPA